MDESIAGGVVPSKAEASSPSFVLSVSPSVSCQAFLALLQCCGDTQWGDWRPHLAVILSNQARDPELRQRVIVTMGDTLGKREPALPPPHVCRSALSVVSSLS